MRKLVLLALLFLSILVVNAQGRFGVGYGRGLHDAGIQGIYKFDDYNTIIGSLEVFWWQQISFGYQKILLKKQFIAFHVGGYSYYRILPSSHTIKIGPLAGIQVNTEGDNNGLPLYGYLEIGYGIELINEWHGTTFGLGLYYLFK